MAESLCEAYRRAVRRRLICPADDRTRLTRRLEAMTAAFAEENPSAGAQEWQDAFGSPEALAKELLAECDPGALAQARRRHNWMVRGCVALLAVLVIAFGTAALYGWKTGWGYTEIETKIYVTSSSPAETSSDDFTVVYDYD